MSLPAVDHTHDPLATSWVPGADDHGEFPVQNLPLGVFSHGTSPPRPGMAIGGHILDLAGIAAAGLLNALEQGTRDALAQRDLNALFALNPSHRRHLRHLAFGLLSDDRHRPDVEPHLHPATACTLHLPARIGDYTDFYVGIHHANNVGALFRPDNPLMPNYKHIPIGYHGRASSVCLSGTPVTRPHGQIRSAGLDAPVHAPCQRLDYELELGVWISGENELCSVVPIGQAWDRVAGICLLNDWSARDIQAWEYQPLGPFLGKSFLTSISPWVVTAEALAPFRAAQPPRGQDDPAPLAYLGDPLDQQAGALALDLEVDLLTQAMRKAGLPAITVSKSNSAKAMYWTIAQMITHHASNGCNLRPGDLLGTGTLSGPSPDSLGSLLELSHGGAQKIDLPSGETRSFLEDGDEIILHASANAPGYRSIGFGACTGIVMPAR
ncbi:MAG: fumarylacetoacetase [Sphingomonadales bacterium]|nr:fumarylacetoacetase [Sphingomonadales bacterium]MDE2170427.1 fumarylacetoacetase [Sphingomonadales bacterium]